MNKIVIANMPIKEKKAIVTLLLKDDIPAEVYVDGHDRSISPGDIYVGHVERVLEKAGGAFVRFFGSEIGFLPQNRQKDIIFCNAKKDRVLKAGDELIVRVETQARANKQAVLTCRLKGNTKFISEIKGTGIHRPSGTCLYRAPSSWKYLYERYKSGGFSKIVTDIPEVCEEIKEAVLYNDDRLHLYRLYSLGAVLDNLLDRKIWLKSGGCITIDQTEAFVCIDVNTSKTTKGKTKEDFIYNVNKEAVEEAARQIRLRQLSGTILIDLIFMEDENRKSELIRSFSELAKEDPIYTNCVDITPLSIMEITRHKVKKSLKEQIACL